MIQKISYTLDGMPLGRRIKNQLKLENFLLTRQAMKAELVKIPIVRSGIEIIDGRETPYVVLKNKVILYGRLPTDFERNVYRRWKNDIAKNITEDTMQVAMDVVLRYLYPHAMPQFTMPYSKKNRRYFHKQHVETIRDLPGMSDEQITRLLKVFEIRKRESFLDVGAYMGYGTVRMAGELGEHSRIISVEADPDSAWLLEQNVKENKLSNVVIIRKAVSNQDGVAPFHKTVRQANSLISEIVSSENTIQIPVTTIDSILKDVELDSINRISITINGAEVEAVEGMKNAVERSEYMRISIAGWYQRDGRRIADIIAPSLRSYGLNVVIGGEGGLLAWK